MGKKSREKRERAALEILRQQVAEAEGNGGAALRPVRSVAEIQDVFGEITKGKQGVDWDWAQV